MGMYQTCYMAILELLDEALGPNDDGVEQGIVADVAFVIQQRDEALARLRALERWESEAKGRLSNHERSAVLLSTDSRGRITLPATIFKQHTQYLMKELGDGSILLTPVQGMEPERPRARRGDG